MDITSELNTQWINLKKIKETGPTQAVVTELKKEPYPENFTDKAGQERFVLYFEGNRAAEMGTIRLSQAKEMWGPETDDWTGKACVLDAETVKVRGVDKEIMVLRAP